MTAGDAHAVGLLVAVASACIVFCRSRSGTRPTESEAIRAAGGGAILGLVVLMLNFHYCDQGTPVMQCVLPAVAIAVVLSHGQSKTEKWVLSTVLLGMMVLLAFHYTDLVHGRRWTGNPHSRRPAARMIKLRGDMSEVRDLLRCIATTEDTSDSEGWLSDTRWSHTVQDAIRAQGVLCREECSRAWHSPLTRLWPTTRVPQDYWYPGGPLTEAVDRIWFRDRP